MDNNDNKVFVVNDGGHDFSKAERFGELIFMTSGYQNPWKLNRLYRIFAKYLKDSNPDDYILMTGLTSFNIVAYSIFARIHGRINLLIFSPKNGDYQEFTLVIDNLIDDIDLSSWNVD